VTAPARRADWPQPADFEAQPDPRRVAAWLEADRAARPSRVDRVRAHFAEAGVDAYFGVRSEHSRYLTGFALRPSEDKVAGNSGWFLVAGEDVMVLADSRYTLQAREQAPDCAVFEAYGDLPDRWVELTSSVGARKVAVEAAFVNHALWRRLEAAAPQLELVDVEGWIEADRAVKEPAELERVARACAIADRALAALLPRIRPGVTETELALDLEWLIRTNGAEALAFDVACLAGAHAALPHGSPDGREVREGEVLLFDFGAQVAGYRSDMTRTLFLGEPAGRDLEVYRLVARAQRTGMQLLESRLVDGVAMPSGREVDAAVRAVITEDGRWPAHGHGTGHGIGLATHELPTLGKRAPETPLVSPTVFSMEPGIYLEGETGVRIEDLVSIDATTGHLEIFTRFPREVLLVGV
jgi:Xaa-Pro aminopeptidase/Xaa-Pro dipeptidase